MEVRDRRGKAGECGSENLECHAVERVSTWP